MTIKTKKIPTSYAELSDEMKNIKIEKLFVLLKELRNGLKNDPLNEEKQYDVELLQSGIDLRLDVELNLGKFNCSEIHISEIELNKINCLENRGSIFIEAFIPDEKIWACVHSTFFITKLSLN